MHNQAISTPNSAPSHEVPAIVAAGPSKDQKLGARRKRRSRRFAAVSIAAVVGIGTVLTGTAAYATLPPAAIGSDGVAPTYAKAANGAVGEVWPAGGQVQFRTLTAGTWSSPTALASLPGGLSVISTTAAVGVNFLGNLEVYVVASDGQVWHSYAASGASNWSSLSPVGAPAVPIAGDVSVGTNYLGSQELYVRATDGEVFHKFATPGQGSGWSGWDTMGRPASGVRGDVAVGKNSFGNQELYIVGNDGRPYHNFATPSLGTGWNGWDPLDGPVAPVGDMSAAINYVGNQELYFVGADGNVWHNYATPGSGSGWAGWSPLGAPAGAAINGDVAVQPHDFAVLGQQWIRVTATNSMVWQDTQTPGVSSGWSGWSAPPPSPNKIIADGVYIVPNQIGPGVYRVGTYWERQDQNQKIIDNDFTFGCASIMVAQPTDAYVKIEGQAVALANSVPFDPIANGCTHGTFLVGVDIQPGRYRVHSADYPYWARLDGSLKILDNDIIASGDLIVIVQPTDFALQISGTLSSA